ncbi:MAG: hypothetical protein KatS3mg051_2254 [Anaerolineae bacterium]|nr:MAG: hypothetical protein KatS3mg051_2254 [Anaerolineae bacterium]
MLRIIPARRERRETLLIVEPEGDYRCWLASLPMSQLRRIDYTARYVPAMARSYRYWCVAGGIVVGIMLMTALFTWLLNGLILAAAILGALPGMLVGGPVGWWLGRALSPRPIWVVKRQRTTQQRPGQLTPVLPQPLVEQYADSRHEFALRASFLHDIRQQRGIARLFSVRASRRYQRLQLTSLIVLAGALAVLIVFLLLVRQEHSAPAIQPVVQEQRL